MKLKNLFTNLNYKIFAFIIGYSLWAYKAADQKMARWITIPVCFYNDKQVSLEAPEVIAIQLQATRSSMQTLDATQLALNIDCQSLVNGPNILANYESYLFLPTDFKVLQWSPTTIEIKKHKINTDE